MSFGELLLEEGMDLEFETRLEDIVSFLDRVVPEFDFGGHNYRLEPVGGVIGTHWDLAVKASDLTIPRETDPVVAFVQVGELEGDTVGMKILSREQWENGGEMFTEDDVKLFSRFAFQLLNALHGEGLMHLPGPLPIE